jgi:hypothetical protein
VARDVAGGVGMVKAGYCAYGVRIKVAGKEKGYGFMESSFYWTWSNVETRRRSERRPPLAPLAPHQPCSARDAPHSLERRVHEGARIAVPDRARCATRIIVLYISS